MNKKNFWHRMVKAMAISILLIRSGMVVSDVRADAKRGLEIAETVRQRERGFGNYTAELEMVLISVAGKETVRRLRVKTMEMENDGDRSLAIFDAPADVKGTAFLSHTHVVGDDDQWLYLPALKRVKRIAPANKTAPFMGSEFSYEDLASWEVEKYTYDYLGEEVLDGRPCFKLERRPIDKHSGYSRQIVWIDQERYIVLRTEYYDRKNVKLKTMLSRQYEQFLNRYWRMGEALMDNHRSGKSSVLRWTNYQFRQPLEEQDFHPARLGRIR